MHYLTCGMFGLMDIYALGNQSNGGDGDIEEDPAFPLPHSQESEDSGSEGMINYCSYYKTTE